MSIDELIHVGTTRHRVATLAATIAAFGGIGAWTLLPGSASASAAAVSAVTADRGTISVTVSGSGPISAGATFASSVSAAAKPTSAAATPAAATPAGVPVTPLVSGRLVNLLVTPGQAVRAGQPIAVLSDPTAAGNVLQAQIALRAAAAAVAGGANGASGLTLAQQRLAAITKPSQTTLTQAQLDVASAKLAYETLRKAPTPPTAAAIAAAKLTVTLSEQKLTALSQPPSQSSVLTAQLAVTQAQAKLNALYAAPPAPLASDVQAAQLALTLAQQQLAALTNPTPAETTAAQLAVSQAQAKLDSLRAAPPAPDAATLAAAQQELALAQQNLAALTAPLPTDATVAAARSNLQAANQALAALQGRSATDPPRIAAQQAVAQASQRLSDLVASPQLASLTQPQLDLTSAQAAQAALLKTPTPPSATALASARLAVTPATEKLVMAKRPDPATLTQAQLDLANAQITQQTDQLRLVAARDTLLLAQLHMQQLTVTTPTAGTVTGVIASPGTQVDPTAALISVADLQHLSVTINMTEFDVAHLKVGDAALVDVAALGGTSIPGRVTAIAPVGVSNSGVVQFPVTVSLSKTAAGIKPGMLASVQVTTAQARGAVRVPLDAISYSANGGKPQVTLLAPNGVKTPKTVTLGLAGPTLVQVVSGVTPGQRLTVPVQPAAAGGGNGTPTTPSGPAGIGVPPASANQGSQN
jgi:multidrug efflux pump subunit AcrA (membrane-fusion protein)